MFFSLARPSLVGDMLGPPVKGFMTGMMLLAGLILLRFSRIGAGLLDDLGEHPLQTCPFQPDRRRFHRKCMWAKGFYLSLIHI